MVVPGQGESDDLGAPAAPNTVVAWRSVTPGASTDSPLATTEPHSDARRVAVIAALVLITVAGGVLRWLAIGTHGLWLDEMGEVLTAARPIPELLDSVRSQAGAAPADFIGVKLVTSLFGDGTVAARLWAFAAGCAAIPLGYAAAVGIFRSRTAGLLAAGLICTSPFLIVFSREARFYSMSVAAALFVLVSHQVARQHHPATRTWILYAVAVVVAVLTHYYLALIPAFVFGATVLQQVKHRSPDTRQRVLAETLALGAAGMLLAPWLAFALPTQLGRSFPYTVPDFTLEWMGNLLGFATTRRSLDDPSTAFAVSSLLVLSVVAASWHRRGLVAAAIGLCALSIVPVAWFLAARAGYQITPRHVILVLPLIFVLAAGGVARVLKGFPTKAAGGILAAVSVAWLALMLSPLADSLTVSGSTMEDWPAATQFVRSGYCPGGVVFTNLSPGIAYYDRSLLPVVRLIDHPSRTLQDALSDLHPGKRDTVVVLAYIGGQFAPNWQGLGALRAYMRNDGWTETQFGSQLYVYSQIRC